MNPKSDAHKSRPARPEPLPVNHDGIPAALQNRNTWVCWRYVWKPDREKWTKVPVNPSNGKLAKSNDADTWTGFATAKAYHENADTESDGLGFMFSLEDTITGIDLDDARDSDTGEPTDTAKHVITTLESFTEISPSGTGYHVLVHGTLPADAKNRSGGIEIYESERFFTVTGQRVDGTPESINRRQESLREVHRAYVANDDTESRETDTKGGGEPSNLSDQQLLEMAKNAEYGEQFTQLWNGDTSGYDSPSEADYALCQQLLFWTQGDHRRAEELFSRSGLTRDKWEARPDYRKRTLEKADSGLSGYYNPSADQQGPTHTTPPEWVTEEAIKSLEPATVVRHAGVDPEEYGTLADAISSLSDREKAAVVWDLLKQSEEYHVRVHRENGELYGYEAGVWKPEGERPLRHAGREALGSTNYGKNVLTELRSQVEADPSVEVPSEAWGLEPGYVAVKNGILDLEAAAGDGDVIRDLHPEDYALSRLPVEYSPEAASGEWHEFVSEVVESDKQDAVQEYVGYCLHRGEMPFNQALLLVGAGANGKSTFLNTVRALLGQENTESKPVHRFGERFSIADLQGMLANIDADLSEGSLSKQGIANFKRLVGNDKVTAERKHKNPFSFSPSAKHLYACNQVPDVNNIVSDDDTAFWRRWVIVQFPEYIPPINRDPGLEDRLTTDESLSAVLNWAIEGWGRLMKQEHFSNVETTAETRHLWQSWGDSADEFLVQCVEHDPDAPNISTAPAWEVYQEWCRREGKDHVGQRKFTNTAKASDLNLGYKQSVRPGGTGQPTNGYKTLGFTDDAPNPETVLESTNEETPGATGLDDFGGGE